MRMASAALALLLTGLPIMAGAQVHEDKPVTHGAFQPEVRAKVRQFVLGLASDFGGFYPDAQFRNVHAVWFTSGSIIVCGELNKPLQVGRRSGWRYFTNSGPLIFESDHLETLCDRRSYTQPGFSDDTEYGADFTRAAVSGFRTPASY
ncbi:MAG: hypothetical protein ACXWKY_18525 [Caulobacteraceae bacterium]